MPRETLVPGRAIPRQALDAQAENRDANLTFLQTEREWVPLPRITSHRSWHLRRRPRLAHIRRVASRFLLAGMGDFDDCPPK